MSCKLVERGFSLSMWNLGKTNSDGGPVSLWNQQHSFHSITISLVLNLLFVLGRRGVVCLRRFAPGVTRWGMAAPKPGQPFAIGGILSSISIETEFPVIYIKVNHISRFRLVHQQQSIFFFHYVSDRNIHFTNSQILPLAITTEPTIWCATLFIALLSSLQHSPP